MSEKCLSGMYFDYSFITEYITFISFPVNLKLNLAFLYIYVNIPTRKSQRLNFVLLVYF